MGLILQRKIVATCPMVIIGRRSIQTTTTATATATAAANPAAAGAESPSTSTVTDRQVFRQVLELQALTCSRKPEGTPLSTVFNSKIGFDAPCAS